MKSAPKRSIPRRVQKDLALIHDVPRTTLSFYKYVHIEDPAVLRNELCEHFSALSCLGRIYIAHEGINAQMNVPTENFELFDSYIKSKKIFNDVHYKFAVEEGSRSSFYKLTIKVRRKIVADGLDEASFDVTNTGGYLSAEEMNAYVDDPNTVIVDMRNAYESEIGHFENALTPDVDSFREELKIIPELLRIHKNRKIALYCTGGIRCEKASAWLKHNGFKDVHHLKGGIIEYAHQVKKLGLPNKFKGKNFVFDERLSESIGGEIISYCHLCRNEKSGTHYHCKNQICHVLFLGCSVCIDKKQGYCSYMCLVLDWLPAKLKRVYARYYNKYFRSTQFKKNRLHA